MQHFIASIRPYVEILYFVGSLVLVLLALYALRQIRLMQQDLTFRVERSASEKAIEASLEYLTTITDLFNEYYEQANKEDLHTYRGPIGDFSPDSIPSEHMQRALKRFGLKSWLSYLNRLESVAAMFTTGVASKKSLLASSAARSALPYPATTTSSPYGGRKRLLRTGRT